MCIKSPWAALADQKQICLVLVDCDSCRHDCIFEGSSCCMIDAAFHAWLERCLMMGPSSNDASSQHCQSCDIHCENIQVCVQACHCRRFCGQCCGARLCWCSATPSSTDSASFRCCVFCRGHTMARASRIGATCIRINTTMSNGCFKLAVTRDINMWSCCGVLQIMLIAFMSATLFFRTTRHPNSITEVHGTEFGCGRVGGSKCL